MSKVKFVNTHPTDLSKDIQFIKDAMIQHHELFDAGNEVLNTHGWQMQKDHTMLLCGPTTAIDQKVYLTVNDEVEVKALSHFCPMCGAQQDNNIPSNTWLLQECEVCESNYRLYVTHELIYF